MKKIIIITLTLLTGSFSLKAQLVQSAPGGNLVWITPESSKIGPAVVYRKDPGDRDYKRIGETSLPASRDDMEKRIVSAKNDFTHLSTLSGAEKDTLMRLISSSSIPKGQRLKYHPVAMLAAGQAFYDKSIPKGVKVSYKITISGADRIVEAPIWPTIPKLPEPVFHEAKEFPDKITLRWKMRGNPNAEGFVVYRRIALKDEYRKINTDGGFVNINKEWMLIVTDTSTTPLSMYEYKVAAIDKAGNEGPMSVAVKARTRGEEVLPYFVYFNGKSNNDGAVSLQWKLLLPQLARSINIYRSKSFDKDFALIGRAAVNDTVYTDQTIEPNENQYYRLEVLMDEGSRTSSVVSVLGKSSGKIPVPQITEAYYKDGKVVLKWIPLAGMVYGYYIYQQMAIGSESLQISHLISPDSNLFMYQPLITGDRYTHYYSVRAVAKDYSLSDPSMPMEVMIRGASKVAVPTGLQSRISEGKALITWDDLFSANDNIAGFTLLRKAEGEKNFVKTAMDTLDPRRTIYEDSNIKPGNQYTYRLEVRDYYGASAFAETNLDYPEITIAPPQQLILSISPGGVHLSWGSTFQEISAVKVYGYTTGTKPAMLATLKKDVTSWLHANPAKGKTWNYYITYVDGNGKESVTGTVRSVRVK